MSWFPRHSDQEYARLFREYRCIYCTRFHIECKCSWWTKHRLDVVMVAVIAVFVAVFAMLMRGSP